MSNSKPPTPKTIGTKQADIQYTQRHAIRVIALNASNQIALLHAQKDNYHKLPGGGIEGTESHAAAAAREGREETGFAIAVRAGGCVAVTEEYRSDLHQFSHAYIADVVDDASGDPDLTAEEQADGLSRPEWLAPGEALVKMMSVRPRSEIGLFIQERDGYLLGEAIRVLGM
ncbi:hypothetical protein F5B22DRAFT_442992 [Xylaria bambusicola]|uniref:uncharacterized protein n=1 Tax=Xylaria bambusicola TaxID=326684 RepID=UPI002008A587|nr:uncharacterized protein F5B22DRAFT_442992 [Xylaria bambusicola]KAI0506610.1 hypothetical protein F5B22DRAFT_442992 [Xylaria bambusicola]